MAVSTTLCGRSWESLYATAFERRRDMEMLFLSGRKLTVPELMKRYDVSRTAIKRDIDIMSSMHMIRVIRGRNGGYVLAEGERHIYKNSLTSEQLYCLIDLIKTVSDEYKVTVLKSIVDEFGPYNP